MRIYELKRFHPAWHYDPATNRQLKVLRFFGVPIEPTPTKGHASGMIWRLCSDPAKKHLWLAYLYSTGDEDDTTSALLPHDQAGLARVVIPEGWRPKRGGVAKTDNGTRKASCAALEEEVADLLKEGSPFDDPLPEVPIPGKCFCFTGRFEFGSRSDCQQAVLTRGGSTTDNLTTQTDVLVVGSDATPTWAHGNYGNKIEAAMLNRMRKGKPVIIPEAFWKELLQK